jgi:hypothetical protein
LIPYFNYNDLTQHIPNIRTSVWTERLDIPVAGPVSHVGPLDGLASTGGNVRIISKPSLTGEHKFSLSYPVLQVSKERQFETKLIIFCWNLWELIGLQNNILTSFKETQGQNIYRLTVVSYSVFHYIQ